MSTSPYADTALHPAADCVFCAVITGEEELIYADDQVVAILDIKPLFPGHLLIMPVQHVVTLDQLPSPQVQPLFGVVQRASAAMAVLGAEGAFVANNNIVSQSVHHLHIHVVPRRKGDGLRGFFWPRLDYDDDTHKQQVATALAAALR